MATQNHSSFDDAVIQKSLDAAKSHAEKLQASVANAPPALAEGAIKLGAQCISVTVQNGQVCLNLPLGIGSVCLPIPSWIPNGTAVQACLDICTKWGIPCGVEVTVTAAGVKVVSQGFGCSC